MCNDRNYLAPASIAPIRRADGGGYSSEEPDDSAD